MRLALLTGVAAALSFAGAAGAQAETVYVTDPAVVTTDTNVVVAEPNVIATTPGYVYAVPAPPFGPFTPRYVVSQPTVVVAPPAVAPRERVIERERVVVSPRTRTAAPRERVVERERVVVESRPEVVVTPRQSGIITTGSSTGSCFIDLNGFERCY
jgi:hypothetical protein